MAAQSRQTESAYAYLSIGFEFIAIFLFVAGLGWLYDIYWGVGRPNGGLLIALFLAFFCGIWHIYRRGRDLQNISSAKKMVPLQEKHLSTDEQIQYLSAEIDSLSKKMKDVLPKNRA